MYVKTCMALLKLAGRTNKNFCLFPRQNSISLKEIDVSLYTTVYDAILYMDSVRRACIAKRTC